MEEPRTLRPLVIASHPHNNSLVVLVHGIVSGRYAAWQDAIDMIQDIYAKGSGTATFASYDYRAFGYESGWVRQPPIETCFDRLRALIDQPQYDTVVLVGHSQGGVVAKLFLVHELLAGRGKDLKVDIVVTLDTPHRGPQAWFYPLVVAGGIWKRLPWVGRWPLLRQLAELSRWSVKLRQLRDCWNDSLIPETPGPAEAGRRHIRSYTIVGKRPKLFPFKAVVSNRSASGFDIDQRLKPGAGERSSEWGTGHGVGAMWKYRHEIERILSNHDYQNVKQVASALATVAPALVEAELTARPPAEWPCEVQCWQRRIVEGFSRRPLRAVSMPGAVQKFMARRQDNP